MPGETHLKTLNLQSWRQVQAEIMRRIRERIWLPGEFIPKEVDLANEFNCARATVNRALRELAEAGVLDRKRKAGTRVASHPVRKAKLDIPITRHEVERLGATYRHKIIDSKRTTAPLLIRSHLKLPENTSMLHLRTLHFADDKPFMYENRWINVNVAPDILEADLTKVSANEWLVNNIPLSTGDIAFSAENSAAEEAKCLEITTGEAIFIIERTTWSNDEAITYARLCYAPGFRLSTII